MPKVKIKPNVGDVVQISLPDGTYAYGRIYKETALAVYEPGNPPESEDYQFIVGFNGGAVESGDWPVVAHRPFPNEESSWQPPKYIRDRLNGKCEIYYKGQTRPASEEECKGLERASVWNANHIVDRIMGSDKWN
jgi:hypothetical protein